LFKLTTGIRSTTPMLALKALAALLRYPNSDLLTALNELRDVLSADRVLWRHCGQTLDRLLATLRAGDLLGAQERFVATFDRGGATALEIFEHRHGASRERGDAMVRLIAAYREQGLTPTAGELPDSLPVVLEFLSMQSADTRRAWLREIEPITRAIGERLVARHSPYAAVFDAVLRIGGAGPLPPPPPRPEIDHNDPVALDAQWIDEPVKFGIETPADSPQVVRFLPWRRRDRG
jgi:nitrate reductase molybdenum cofactor assembly chaperone NarJ/NarW